MLRCAITDRHLIPAHPDDPSHPGHEWTDSTLNHLLARCAALVPSNLDFLLIREKDLPAATLLTLARAVVALFRQTPTRILVARRPDVALAAAAHGVHLSAAPGELAPAQARVVFPAAFITRSCHTVAEVRQANRDHADAILFGPIFGKTVAGRQVAPAIGLDALREACRAAEVPVLALGGITLANTPQCLATGAAGIAAIRMFFPE